MRHVLIHLIEILFCGRLDNIKFKLVGGNNRFILRVTARSFAIEWAHIEEVISTRILSTKC